MYSILSLKIRRQSKHHLHYRPSTWTVTKKQFFRESHFEDKKRKKRRRKKQTNWPQWYVFVDIFRCTIDDKKNNLIRKKIKTTTSNVRKKREYKKINKHSRQKTIDLPSEPISAEVTKPTQEERTNQGLPFKTAIRTFSKGYEEGA